MTDIEKVIQGLEVCLQDDGCTPCPYYRKENDYFCGVTDIMRDALDIIKEQREEIESLRQTCQSMMEGIVVTASNKKKLPYLPGSNVQWT